jgi:hypothetical protein
MMSRTKKPINRTIYKSGTNGPRLLPLKKAADYLGLTVWSMRERIWAGDIPVVRFPGGRKMFIDVLDLEEFIQRNKEVFKQ